MTKILELGLAIEWRGDVDDLKRAAEFFDEAAAVNHAAWNGAYEAFDEDADVLADEAAIAATREFFRASNSLGS